MNLKNNLANILKWLVKIDLSLNLTTQKQNKPTRLNIRGVARLVYEAPEILGPQISKN